MKGRNQKKKTVQYFDYNLLAIIVFLMCFGLVMLYSSSSYEGMVEWNDPMYFFKRQAFFSFVSFFGMLFVSRWDYHKYAKVAKLSFFVAMFMMSLVYFTPLGIERNGARRWLRFPIIGRFQPSEIMKVAVIIFIPYVICKLGKKINKKEGFYTIFGWGMTAFFGVYVLTDNLSTAIIVLGVVLSMYFVAHKQTKIFVMIAGGGLAAFVTLAVILGNVLESSTSFRLRRIIAWLHPEQYAANVSFQTVQSLYAIGSGGLFGKGLGNSAQKILIPEAQNDMILAIICEELGVFGALMVLTLFGLLLYRLLFIARNAPDKYGSLMVTGIFSHIALQVILNIAVVTNMIPNTGITLPFISYGGTSIVFLMGEMGLALGVSNRIKFDS